MSIRFRHFPMLGVTVGFRAQRTREDAPGLRVETAVAFTSPRDQFSRHMGRTVTTSRLNSDKEDIKYRHVFFFDTQEMPQTGREWREFENEIVELIEDEYDISLRMAETHLKEDWDNHIQEVMG